MIAHLLLGLVVDLVPAALVSRVSVRVARSSRNEWKLIAFVPVLPLAAWGLYIAWETARDPTSHNLWPFELAFWCMVSCAMFLVVLAARRAFSGRVARSK